MSFPPPTSRSKPASESDEQATSILNLGEFQDANTLTLSEASLVINAVAAKRRKEGKPTGRNVFMPRTLDYLETFSRFRKKENVEAVERLLSAHQELARFERAQLGNLCCEKAEEAKTLIPSLTDKISDEDLQELLDEMAKFMTD